MIKKSQNKNDVFKTFLLEKVDMCGFYEFPCIKKEILIPNKLIPFSKIFKTNDFNQWVHFYEKDYKFNRIWNQPNRYLAILKKFNGIIEPDFSIYRNLPLAIQIYNVFKNRSLASWYQNNGIHVIPNIRFGDTRSISFFCDGVEKNGVIAIGTLGVIKNKINRNYLIEGLYYANLILRPKIIIVYGTAPNEIFNAYKKNGIKIIQFKSEISQIMENNK